MSCSDEYFRIMREYFCDDKQKMKMQQEKSRLYKLNRSTSKEKKDEVLQLLKKIEGKNR